MTLKPARSNQFASKVRHTLRMGSLLSSRYSVLLSFFIAPFFPASDSAEAAIVNAASPSRSDVAAAVATAVAGDTIVIPPGTTTWTWPSGGYGLEITKAITLQGSGVGSTIIKNGSGDWMIVWRLVSNKASRMTGIEFQDGAAPPSNHGVVYLDGGSYSAAFDKRTMRVDHCKFDHLNGFIIQSEDVIGVVDHNTFLASAGSISMYIYNRRWNNQGTTADGSWIDSSHFGTSQFLFIEDNIFTLDTAYALLDGYAGTRWVFRHNSVTRGHLEIHGTDSAGRLRGGRAFEVYNNSFAGPTQGDYVINGRSGVFVIHDNVTTGITNPGLHLAYYRMCFPFWDASTADGTNRWDVNLVGGPFFSGTAGGGGSTTAIVSTARWTPNQWAGYSIKKTSNNGTGQTASEIVSNTSTTITYLGTGGFDFGTPSKVMTFNSGDTFEIYKVLHSIDQPGRSGGSLIMADPPLLPSGWNNQITEPCYEWNNVKTEGGGFHFGAANAVIRANEHYFNNTQAPGYTPYTYPHPLTSGSGQPNPPANLRIN
jgi:hypothetical protein